MLGDLKFLDQYALIGLTSVTPMPIARANSAMHVRRCMALGLMLVPIALACGQPARAGMPRTQRHEVRHEIDQLEDAWRNALMKGNTAAMDALLADDYMAISALHNPGYIRPEGALLRNHRAGDLGCLDSGHNGGWRNLR